ncbi:MAG: methionine adenosyltransferase [Planctomycetia bacterium]|nr:methionine adenosyltransferase [Planctomycetia bacterium]
MTRITIEQLPHVPVALRQAEHVERKGLGHPDSICDAVMEAVSVALCAAYRAACGRVLHHNVDKGLLVAGQSSPRLGGGTVQRPMRFVFGDRATAVVGGRPIPVGEIVETAARKWLREHLRFVDPALHAVFQNEIQPGSAELVGIFSRDVLSANDTSAAVGYAPLTETERLVLQAERYLNSPDYKRRFPEVGEDVKVMAVRRGRQVSLTVAAAFVDRFVQTAQTYFERKREIRDDLERRLRSQLHDIDRLDVDLNTLDDPGRGLGGMYLTVLGTSAEGADGGEVGRGNRVNGLISLHRPMSLEAAAGKNPVSHVGKIYNVLAHEMAERVHKSCEGVAEATVWLASQIGRPLDDPWSVAVELIPAAGASAADVERSVRETIEAELRDLPKLIERLVLGQLPVC